MVLAAPGPLLTPPPSSSPPKTPHRSYSAQTRSQNEEKNPPHVLVITDPAAENKQSQPVVLQDVDDNRWHTLAGNPP
jgi:hypothetical protein